MRLRWVLLLVCLVLPGLPDPQSARAQIFRSDDPIRSDRDDIPVPKPDRKKINDYFDFLENTFFRPGDRTAKRALNINTLGEVPDSSWYTNRISRRNLSREELTRGPDTGTGPAPGPWTVISGKSQGISPGFRIRDSRGEVYFLKFDPLTNPELSSAAEIISTKFFHALGYNVPENYLVDLVPADLTVDPAATVENELGEKVPLRLDRIEALLRTVARGINGTIRTVASRMIKGEDVGPFKFYGTRADDPNDVFPHEHRRELRGYFIFCSWLNHDDSRSINTRDFYVAGTGGGHVKHYLIDFGSTLGSGSVFAQKRRAGNEYLWEAGPTFRSMVSFGIWLRPWVMVEYPDYPSIGRFEANFFRPERWKPEYPNAAFELMDPEDAFWAVRQVMRFSDEDIRAIVRTGRLSDPAAEDYLVRSLITRRDKIGNYWLRQILPLDGFRVEGDRVRFEDLLVTHGFERIEPERDVVFSEFDNRTGERRPIGEPRTIGGGELTLPAAVLEAPKESILVVRISGGRHHADVFLSRASGAVKIVGIERK